MKLALATAAAALLSGIPLFGYAYFLHYDANNAAIPERYNLAQLPDKTVTFYVSDNGPATYNANDNFPSVVNQIRAATDVWNNVATSDLRVTFGGLYTDGPADNSPGGSVVFEDLPPGVLAYSGPTTCEDTTADGPPDCRSQAPATGDAFVPILRSVMHMSRNLSALPGPSFSELFFLVSVHEMGHALGLQHTFASSTMSTITTRATSHANPIDADDRAGISNLYPKPAFQSLYGSISGQVTYSDDGTGTHMASVVAFSSTAPTVSALTLPDGTFQINGVKPGQYFLYVHPLPPDADIRSPRDSNSNPVDPSRPFNAVLYPNQLSTTGATTVAVTAGQNSSGYNFSVTPRSSVPIYDIGMYSYYTFGSSGTNAVHPAFLSVNANPPLVVASGVGIAGNGATTTGLKISALSGTASVSEVKPYTADGDTSGTTYLALYLNMSPFGSLGPQHLLFATSDYLYLLPSAFTVVASDPPAIASVITNADGTVTISGNNLKARTSIYFDSLPAANQNMDVSHQTINLTPPMGASGQTATLTAYDPDGLNSMFLQVNLPPTFTYASISDASLAITPANLPAGAEAMIDVAGTNTNFVQGRTAFGFGTHDVIVRQAFVLSPTHALVDVGMPTGAAQITGSVTALTDFQIASASNAFQIQSPQTGLPTAYPVLFNGVLGQTGSFASAIVSLYGTNLQASSDAVPTVTIGGQQASLLYTSPGLINLQVPSTLSPGVTELVINNGSISSFPVAVRIDPPEAVIVSFLAGSTAHVGDTIDAIVSGFPAQGGTIDPSRVQISVGGVSLPAVSVNQVGTSSNFDVQFVLTSDVQPGTQLPVVVYLDGLSSVQNNLTVD